jgi:putative methionine-R-sulfoxide reductase with GAF domain
VIDDHYRGRGRPSRDRRSSGRYLISAFDWHNTIKSTTFTMGKSQKKRAMRRHNPMRVPDSHLPKGLAAASSSSNKTEAVLPIIKKVEPLLFFFHSSPVCLR